MYPPPPPPPSERITPEPGESSVRFSAPSQGRSTLTLHELSAPLHVFRSQHRCIRPRATEVLQRFNLEHQSRTRLSGSFRNHVACLPYVVSHPGRNRSLHSGTAHSTRDVCPNWFPLPARGRWVFVDTNMAALGTRCGLSGPVGRPAWRRGADVQAERHKRRPRCG